MKFNIEFVNTSVNDDLEIMVLEKLEALQEKYNWIVGAQVFLKRERKDPVKGKVCEIRLSLPGPIVFASNTQETFELAINKVIENLNLQLKKRKDIMKTHH